MYVREQEPATTTSLHLTRTNYRTRRGFHYLLEYTRMSDRTAFANGEGASVLHVCLVVCVPYVAALSLGPYFTERSWHLRLVIDLITIVLPTCAACLCIEHRWDLYLIYGALLLPLGVKLRSTLKERTRTNVSSVLSLVNGNRSPVITQLRGAIALQTAFCILGVDFHLFPRANAKTLNYGRSVMDLGVGAVVLAGALTTRRRPRESISVTARRAMVRHAPLVAAGLGRLVAVRATAYHEVHSEYGVHWNFFFTLAAVAAGTPALERATERAVGGQSAAATAVAATVVLALHQTMLSFGGLSAYVRDSPRTSSFLSANKEGLASLPGYLGLGLAGNAASAWFVQTRYRMSELWLDVAKLAGASVMFGLSAVSADSLVEPTSRRLCNLAYVLWVLAQVGCALSFATIGSLLAAISPRPSPHPPPILESINRNPLSFFLLSNLLTGACNLSIDTMQQSDAVAAMILATYMTVVCTTAVLADASQRSVTRSEAAP